MPKKMEKNKLFYTLMLCNGLSNMGHFTVYALLAVYFLNYIPLSSEKTSFLLFFAAVSMRLSRILFAPIIDLIGSQKSMFISMMLCSLGYLLLGLTHKSIFIMLSLLIIGVGYGSNSLIIKCLISSVKHGTLSSRFIWLNVATNIMASIGPFIGNLILINFPTYCLFLFSASLFFITAIIILLSKTDVAFVPQQNLIKEVKSQLRLRKTYYVILLAVFCWFLIAQFFSFLPIYITNGLNQQPIIGQVFLINSAIIILLSIPISNFLTKHRILMQRQLLIFFVTFLIGLIILMAQQNIFGLYLAAILWSIGELIMTPALNTLVAKMVNKTALLSTFAINAIAMGIGEGLGNFIGVLLAGYSSDNKNWSISFLILLIFTFTFIIFLILKNIKKKLMFIWR